MDGAELLNIFSILAAGAIRADHGTGAVINVTIKSGSNAFHGSAFEFLRKEKVDARNFFASPTAAAPEFRRNQYGFSVGGPIIKNHTFFLRIGKAPISGRRSLL